MPYLKIFNLSLDAIDFLVFFVKKARARNGFEVMIDSNIQSDRDSPWASSAARLSP